MKTREECAELAAEVLGYLETKLADLKAKLDAADATDLANQSILKTEIRLLQNTIRRAKFQVDHLNQVNF